MATRRAFIGSFAAAAAAALPMAGWAEAGAPSHLSAARAPDGSHHLVGLRSSGDVAFMLALPGRGHAAAAHPTQAHAVTFARRPGTFAMVLDCACGAVRQKLHAPEGRHFYGHGAFTRDGQRLLTTENDIASGIGKIGVWHVGETYQRLGDLPSNGIGPHEMIRLPEGDFFAVANGGIRTHPDTGREKLNLDTMQPNLTILDAEGGIHDVAQLPSDLRQNSLRHISAFPDGRVACAFQWQGDPFDAPPIAGIYTPGRGLEMVEMDMSILHRADGYAGSVAALGPHQMGVTFPRANQAHVFDLKADRVMRLHRRDVCGIASARPQTLITDGNGGVHSFNGHEFKLLARHSMAFDNHLVAIAQA